MLRHKSTPCLLLATVNSSGCDGHPRGDLEDRYHDLQEQHLELRREANEAQDQIRMLNTRLSRLLAEKKRFYRNVKSEREIALEEKLFELERLLWRQEQQNERLKERLQLMRINCAKIDHHRPISSSLNRISSAYSQVRSRTDSGLGFYFRPLSLSQNINKTEQPKNQQNNNRRARSQIDLRQRSVKFQEHLPETESPLPLITATQLMKEAKEEIIRLEAIVEKQQQVIDEFQKKSKSLHIDNNSKSLLSYTIMTTTTTSNLTATADNNNSTMMINDRNIIDNIDQNDNQSIESLWSKYHQIMMHKENFQQMSLECQQLIERLYKAVKEEEQRCQQLKMKLNSIPDHLPTLLEKDKIIETLRKENVILQNSLKQCINQCMVDAEQQQSNGFQPLIPSQYDFDRIQELWKQKRHKYEEKIFELDAKLNLLSEDLRQQKNTNDSLRMRYENLKQLNDNDQLKIEHLEKKVKRLSKILFYQDDNEDENKNNGNNVEEPENSREQIKPNDSYQKKNILIIDANTNGTDLNDI